MAVKNFLRILSQKALFICTLAVVIAIGVYVIWLPHREPPDPRAALRYTPTDSRELGLPSGEELQSFQGMEADWQYFRDFIAYWELEKVKVVRTDVVRVIRGLGDSSYHDGQSLVETYYAKMLTNYFTCCVVTSKSNDRRNLHPVSRIVVVVPSLPRPSDLALKTRVLPYGLAALDTPDKVWDKYGRPETMQLDENGSGYMDYFGAIDKGLAFKVWFARSNIFKCEFN